MVKAFSYGSGSAEIARLLQFHKVDYLAVAYADEGVELRRAGISLPILVMNAEETGFEAMIEHQLEPEIYSLNSYLGWRSFLRQQGIRFFPVHLKLNTGMNRLGFDQADIRELCSLLESEDSMTVRSVFSHLAASESADFDGFTRHQSALFERCCSQLKEVLGYDFIRHISNSAAVFRHPQLQYDMVRIGIGLYGINSAGDEEVALQTVATLRSTVAQLRMVPAGETVGYNRKGLLTRDSRIATICVGYADGVDRKLGNGAGSVYIRESLAPVIGNVCMDMLMVDVTDVAGVKEGDEVELFGPHLPVERVAASSGTIVYEVLTRISQRVKRVYVEE
jgi:alanine racemase